MACLSEIEKSVYVTRKFAQSGVTGYILFLTYLIIAQEEKNGFKVIPWRCHKTPFSYASALKRTKNNATCLASEKRRVLKFNCAWKLNYF